MHKPVYIAAYHQSEFGKLMGMTVPEIIKASVNGVCREIKADPSVVDVGSVGATCTYTLNQQGLLAGLMATVPGLAGKPIESVENACASGGQAILSVIYKLLLGLGEVGIAVGFEKMRDNEGKMDGKLIGQALGVFSHPDERPGKVYIFPHIFAEVMADYMKTHGVDRARPGPRVEHRVRQRQQQPVRADAQDQGHARRLREHRRSQQVHHRGPAAEDVRLLADHRRLRGGDRRDRGRPEAAGRGEGRHACRSRATRRRPTACCARTATC